MKSLGKFLVVLFVLTTWCGTVEAREPLSERIMSKVHFVRVVDVTHLSTSGMNLYVEIENETGHRLVFTDAEIDILSNGELMATISLRDKVVLKRRSTNTVLVPLRFKSRSSFVLGRLLTRVLSFDADITINYRFRGGIGPFRQTFEQKDIDVKKLLENFKLSEIILKQINDHIK